MDAYFEELVNVLYDGYSEEDQIFEKASGVLSILPGIVGKIIYGVMSFRVHKDVRAASERAYSDDYVSMYSVRDMLEEQLAREFPDPEKLREADLAKVLIGIVDNNGGISWLRQAYEETILRGNELMRVINAHGRDYVHSREMTSDLICCARQELKYLTQLYSANSN